MTSLDVFDIGERILGPGKVKRPERSVGRATPGEGDYGGERVLARVRGEMGEERFARARKLSRLSGAGLTYDRLPEADRVLMDEFGRRRFDAVTDEHAGLTLAAQSSPSNPLDVALQTAEAAMSSYVGAHTDMVMGIASLLGPWAPRSMNEMIGLESMTSPKPGLYLRALLDDGLPEQLPDMYGGEGRPSASTERFAEKIGYTPEQVQEIESAERASLSSAYHRQASQQHYRDVIDPAPVRWARQGAEMAGELAAIMGPGKRFEWLSPLAKTMGATERLLRLDRGARFAAQMSAKSTKLVPKTLWRMVAEGAVPGARFAAFEGLANYVDPVTGEPLDGAERLEHALRGAAIGPLMSLVGPFAARVAAKLRGDGVVIRAAWGKWMSGLDDSAKAAVQRAGDEGFSTAWNTFVMEGMPGMRNPGLLKRIGADAVQSLIESAGMAITDGAFWHNVANSLDDPKAMGEAVDQLLSGAFGMSMLRFGGSHRALSARQWERLQADLQSTLAGDAQRAQRAPEAMPEPVKAAEPEPVRAAEPSVEPEPVKAAEPEPVRAAEPSVEPESVKPPKPKVDVPEDAELTARVEGERWLEFAEGQANRLGVKDALTKKTSPERSLWLAYAARIRHWLEGGQEGPRPRFPGGRVPDEVMAFEKDQADRRARAAEYRAKAARGEVEPVKTKEPSTRDSEAAWDAEQMRGMEQTAEVQKTKADLDQAIRHVRNAELAEAKLALDGIGGPTSEEDIRLVYNREAKPYLVTYRDGKYQRRDLYGNREWKEMPADEALKLRGKAPDDPISIQLAVVDQLAKRALDLGEQMTTEQVRLFGAAANLVARTDRAKDPGIDAALSLAEQTSPDQWSPRHFDLWAQMALRGMSPEAQQAVLEHFRATPAAPPEKPAERAARKRAEKRAASPAPQTPPPRQPEPAAGVVEGQPAAGSVAVPEKTADGLNALPDAQLRNLAETAGLDSSLPREELLRSLGAESGAIDARVALTVGAGAVAAAAAYAATPHLAPYIGGGLAILGAMPWIYRNLAIPAYERLRSLGDRRLAEQAIGFFRRVSDRIKHYEGRFADVVRPVLSLTRERGAAEDVEATQWLQNSTWSSNDPDAYAVSNFQRAMEGDVGVDAPSGVAKIVDAVRNVIRLGGDLGTELGVMMLERSSGRSFKAKFRSDSKRLPRVLTGDGIDIINSPGSEAWNRLRDAVADMNGITIEESALRLEKLRNDMNSFQRAAMEFTRVIEKMPDGLRVNGREIMVYESRPFEYVKAYSNRQARRLAHLEVWGQEDFSQAGQTRDEHGDVLGVKLTESATPEQIAARESLRDFVLSAERRDEATRGVIEAMRLQAGLPTTNSKGALGFDVSNEGRVRHLMRHAILPLRALDVSLKLVKAVTPNLAEPFIGAAQTILGDMAVATGSVYADAVFNRDKLRKDTIRYQAIGGLVTDQTLRWGAFSKRRAPGTRSADLARQMALPAIFNTRANHFSDLALARRTEAIVEQLRSGDLSPGERGRIEAALSQLDFTPAEKQQFLSGKFDKELGYTFMRRARERLMFVRGSEDSGALGGDRIFKFLFPFTQWASGNLRYNARVIKDFAQTFGPRGEQMSREERTARRVNLLRWGIGKATTAAVVVLSRAAWAYANEMLSAFEGGDDKETAQNFLVEVATASAMTELGLPVISIAAMDALGRGRRGEGMIEALAGSTWPVDMSLEVFQALARQGEYRTVPTDLAGVPAVVARFMANRAPFLRDFSNWSTDTELMAARRRRYQLIKPKSSSDEDEYFDAFQNAMGRAAKRLQENANDINLHDRDEVRKVLREAMLSKLDEKRSDPITGEAFSKQLDVDERRIAWGSVIDSLNSRRVVAGLDPEEMKYLRREMGDRLVDRLEEFDRTMDKFTSWAKWQQEMGR